jgi:hypothetical protein
VPLDPAARAGTVRQILEDASYDFVFARRCKNDDRLGVRFQRGQERVEFVLGVPCMHTAWYFRVNGEVQLTGAVLVDDAARAVIQLASDAGVAVAVK